MRLPAMRTLMALIRTQSTFYYKYAVINLKPLPKRLFFLVRRAVQPLY